MEASALLEALASALELDDKVSQIKILRQMTRDCPEALEAALNMINEARESFLNGCPGKHHSSR